MSQAAEEAKVSRQYIHSILPRFTPLRLGSSTGPILIYRVELEAWILDRKKKKK